MEHSAMDHLIIERRAAYRAHRAHWRRCATCARGLLPPWDTRATCPEGKALRSLRHVTTCAALDAARALGFNSPTDYEHAVGRRRTRVER
jgi:hypothetical protein